MPQAISPTSNRANIQLRLFDIQPHHFQVHLTTVMAPKNNAKGAAKGKGKDAGDDKSKGKGAVKGAQTIQVRHILVCSTLLFPRQ
jgi:hypothetical protein